MTVHIRIISDENGEEIRKSFRRNLRKYGLKSNIEYNLLIQSDHEFTDFIMENYSIDDDVMDILSADSCADSNELYHFGTLSLHKKRDREKLKAFIKRLNALKKIKLETFSNNILVRKWIIEFIKERIEATTSATDLFDNTSPRVKNLHKLNAEQIEILLKLVLNSLE